MVAGNCGMILREVVDIAQKAPVLEALPNASTALARWKDMCQTTNLEKMFDDAIEVCSRVSGHLAGTGTQPQPKEGAEVSRLRSMRDATIEAFRSKVRSNVTLRCTFIVSSLETSLNHKVMQEFWTKIQLEEALTGMNVAPYLDMLKSPGAGNFNKRFKAFDKAQQLPLEVDMLLGGGLSSLRCHREVFASYAGKDNAETLDQAACMQVSCVTLQSAFGLGREGKSRTDLIDIAVSLRSKICRSESLVPLPKGIDDILTGKRAHPRISAKTSDCSKKEPIGVARGGWGVGAYRAKR